MFRQYKCQVSFIIPVYNGQDTIERCLNSIYSQDWKEDQFEVIVIDDCSTDNTFQILNVQSALHKNLSIIRFLENSKPGSARNRGFEQSHGEYIMYVDADDTVENGIISALKYALEAGVDILYCRVQEQLHFKGQFQVKEYRMPEHVVFTGQTFCENYYTQDRAGAFMHYLFKYAYLIKSSYKFAENVIYEDLDWTERHLFEASSIAYDSSIIYSYFATPSSILHTKSISQDADKLLFSYRRLLFAESIKEIAPNFYEKIVPIKAWIGEIFSFRHMTRHTFSSVNALFDKVGPNALRFFSCYSPAGFPGVCTNHPGLAKVLLFFSSPFCMLLRKLKNKLHF